MGAAEGGWCPVIEPTDEMERVMYAALAEQEPGRHHAALRKGLAAVLAIVEASYRGLLEDLADPDPCWYDHHGYCQAHGWLQTDPKCPHLRAKELL